MTEPTRPTAEEMGGIRERIADRLSLQERHYRTSVNSDFMLLLAEVDHLLAQTQKENPMVEHISQFFQFAHLPAHLQEVSKPFADLAEKIVAELPRNPERTVALRKLLEAKDAAVRAKLARDV